MLYAKNMPPSVVDRGEVALKVFLNHKDTRAHNASQRSKEEYFAYPRIASF
jgi:hypothetical protein